MHLFVYALFTHNVRYFLTSVEGRDGSLKWEMPDLDHQWRNQEALNKHLYFYLLTSSGFDHVCVHKLVYAFSVWIYRYFFFKNCGSEISIFFNYFYTFLSFLFNYSNYFCTIYDSQNMWFLINQWLYAFDKNNHYIWHNYTGCSIII